MLQHGVAMTAEAEGEAKSSRGSVFKENWQK